MPRALGAGLRSAAGHPPMSASRRAEFGPVVWIEVPQEKIQAFADTTGDHNFIHVDPEMAAQTPFGGTVAHGYLTLSLLPAMSYEVLPHDEPGAGMALNYGLNKVRFPAPVPSGSRVRGTFRVDAVDGGGLGPQSTMTATIEREGGEKPVCVAEVVYRYYRL